MQRTRQDFPRRRPRLGFVLVLGGALVGCSGDSDSPVGGPSDPVQGQGRGPQGGPPPVPAPGDGNREMVCKGVPEEDRDDCFAERAMDLAGRDPHGAFLEAGRIRDTTLRDLAIVNIVRETEWDRCDQIEDPVLRESCEHISSRPHLRPGRSQKARTRPALESLPEACRSVGADFVDLCLMRESAGAEAPQRAMALCEAITDTGVSGECWLEVARRLVTEQGDLDRARGVCEEIPREQWRDECMFRLSELSEIDDLQERMALCSRAGRFEAECFAHLNSRVASRAAGPAIVRSFEVVLARMESQKEAFVRGVRQATDVRDLDLDRSFWWNAFHGLAIQAVGEAPIPRWRGLLEAFPTGDPRRLQFDTILLMVWTQYRAQVRLLEGVDVLTSEHLQQIRAEYEGAEDLLAPSDAPLVAEPSRPYLLAGGKNLDLEALRKEGTPSDGFVPVGRTPWPLDHDPVCPMSAEDRATIVQLWALEPFPWSVVRPVVQSALQHDTPLVRSYALDSLAARFFLRPNQGPPPAWVLPNLARRRNQEPYPAIAQQAQALAQQLRNNVPPSPQVQRSCFDGPPAEAARGTSGSGAAPSGNSAPAEGSPAGGSGPVENPD